MTLVTTPGDPNADSYATLAEADAYFAALGNLLWTATDAFKEVFLRRATRYLDNQYRNRWIGIRTNQTQALGWPRADGYRTLYRIVSLYPLLDIDGFQIDMQSIPNALKKATFEAAYLALSGRTLEAIVSRDDQQIARQRVKVDVLEKETEFSGYSIPLHERYIAIEGLLRGLVVSTPGSFAGTVQLVRA